MRLVVHLILQREADPMRSRSWIFFLEGGFTALFGILLFFLLPGSPSTSRFLTADQKAHIERRLKLDSPAGTTDFEEAFSWREVRKAATSPHVVFLLVALFSNRLLDR